MIRLRDDDVLLTSKGWGDPFARFRQIHDWAMLCPQILHVPAILVDRLEAFPDCSDYIRSETSAGRMQPEFHGMEHLAYGRMRSEDVQNHLRSGIDWMEKRLGVRPHIWFTPWGASEPHLHEAAKHCDLELVDTSAILTIQRVIRGLREGSISIDSIRDSEIFCHWWERGERVKRLALAVNYGSWSAAASEHRELFGV